MKKCTKCKINKSDVEFYSNRGNTCWCKQCHSEYYKKKSYSKCGKPKQIREDLDNGNRICNKCKVEKNLKDFPKNKKCNSGRERKCKECLYISRKTKKRIANQKRLRKRWYLENKQLCLDRQSKRYEENKEELKEYARQYHRDNPEVSRAASHRRRTAIYSNGNNNLTANQIKELFEKQKSCVYCGCEDNLTIDHIIPISKGGQNTLSNIVVACSPCNNKKRAKLA